MNYRRSLLFLLFILSTNSFAQSIELSQSSPEINWKTISNERVKLIFPDFLKSKSLYISNLVDHYSKVVGTTYGISEPHQFTLVIRPEKANLNGFVTLGPRRSEWFSSASFTPILGGADFYQALAIHEYRHVIQFDNYNKGSVKGLDYFFGDAGISLAAGLGLRSWYFEGDAVWAETKYTNVGRGRSPRFLSRLKALVLSDQIPTYDQFVNGTYSNSIPNHYVFGYVLVTSATKKYGDDFWSKVVGDISSFPHPWRLMSSFEDVAGIDFYDFYTQTMNELKELWKDEKLSKSKVVDFRENISPKKVGDKIYYLNYDLNSFWKIMEKSKNGKRVVTELPFYKDLNQIDFSKKYAVFNQFKADHRYLYKETSELSLIELASGDRRTIVENRRIYNPSFNKSGDKIFAVEFDIRNNWKIVEFDLDGNELRDFKLKKEKVVEVKYLDDHGVVILTLDSIGQKAIKLIDLKKRKIQTLLDYSRNNISQLYVDKYKNVLFEAQDNGRINIFKINKSNKLSKCTNQKIGGYFPSSDGKYLLYSAQDYSGSKVAKASLSNCKNLSKDSLINFNYLGDTPSDNYGEFELKHFNNQKEMYSKNKDTYKEEEHSSVNSRLFIPHSWSFFTDRGYGLSVNTDNYLRTLGLSAVVGNDSEEGQLYYGASISFKKYYPIFNLGVNKTAREVEVFNSNRDLKWDEFDVDFGVTFPYLYSENLKTGITSLTLGAKSLNVTNYRVTAPKQEIGDQDFLNGYLEFSTSFSKDKKFRSLEVPWGISYRALYEYADNTKSPLLSSYQFYQNLNVVTSGAFNFDGFIFSYTMEEQEDTLNSYRFSPIGSQTGGYVFSRGYSYTSVPKYEKISANYFFPLGYPDWRLWGLLYIKRAKLNAFYDYTSIDTSFYNQNLESAGAEIEFESTVFRILPIDFGYRYINKITSKTHESEFYLGTEVTFY